jgi:hypothetical protein
MPFLALLVVGLAVADGASLVRPAASGRGLAVAAQRAPLSAVLEEIGRRAGTRVTYEGPPPSTLVSCDFVAATASEAFVRALEGLGLNYVLYGGSVEVPAVLLVARRTGGTAAPAAPAPAVADATDEANPVEEEAPAMPPPGLPARFMHQSQEQAPSETTPSPKADVNSPERAGFTPGARAKPH